MTAMAPREGIAQVPGARLRYRLAGTPGAPLLVFENGWGASWEMWAWVEQELAAHAQLLFYDRAGIGGSELLAPQTVAGLSTQFAALPAALGFTGPVIAVGQSYGGLVCALHAAQCPGVLRGVVEIDPTPTRAIPSTDDVQRKLPALIRLIKVCLHLGLPNFFFAQVVGMLPPGQGRALLRWSLSNPASLDAGLAEFALRDEIRGVIAAGPALAVPRLLIGAGALAPLKGLASLLADRKRVQASFDDNQAQQRVRAAEDPACRLTLPPYDHGALVFDRDGARATSAEILAFLS